jgi:putative transposase
MARPKKREIALSELERKTLVELTRSRITPHGLVRRVEIVLASADGETSTSIARRVGVSMPTVGKWRSRFLESGLLGLYGEDRPGRPRSHDDEKVANLLQTVLESAPEHGTHWSVRSAAQASGISKSSVQRYFQAFGIQPHRTKSFKLSTDPYFVEKVRDIVGLYLNPPEHAVVLCVDEKSQIQALERTQPVLPMGLGYVEGVTHDYFRHGTTTLFAALDMANGTVLADCKPQHRHQEFLAFLKKIDKSVPAELDVHVIADNYGTHKHPKVWTWLANHPRFTMHYTPTYSSWLNQVERWFGHISEKAIRRGSFRSAKELVAKIEEFVDHYNQYARPFVWTATADSILKKVEMICKLICGTGH